MPPSEPPADDDELVTIGTAARMAGVTGGTVRRWCTNGWLPYERIGPKRDRFIRRRDVVLFLIVGKHNPPKVCELRQMVDAWDKRLAELLPWKPEAADTAERISELLVALRGPGGTAFLGGLISRLLELVSELESALERPDDHKDLGSAGQEEHVG